MLRLTACATLPVFVFPLLRWISVFCNQKRWLFQVVRLGNMRTLLIFILFLFQWKMLLFVIAVLLLSLPPFLPPSFPLSLSPSFLSYMHVCDFGCFVFIFLSMCVWYACEHTCIYLHVEAWGRYKGISIDCFSNLILWGKRLIDFSLTQRQR